MRSEDDRIEEALSRLLKTREEGRSIAVEAIVAEHPDLEEPLRARLRVFRMLEALRVTRAGDLRPSSTRASWSLSGADPGPASRDAAAGGRSPPTDLPRSPAGPWGRYTVDGEIARGGVGVVLKAHDPDLGRDVALKTLREEHATRPDVLQRFVEEAQIGGQLQHPGVVPVYELGIAGDGHPYFAMKLVKGKTLAHVLADRTQPTDDLPRLLAVFQAICQTVAYAHERRIVHRDLKPSNVMMGAFGEVQVFDWGMAKVLARGGAADDARRAGVEEAEPASLVRTVRSASGSAPSVEGSVLGTPQYMAPEQARGEVALLDERADVFSLGAILCEILTGRAPYTGTGREVLVAAAEARLAPAHERLLGCGADPELVALATRCLAPERNERPRDAGVLAREITAHLASLAERARKAEVAAGEARVLVAEERRARRLTRALSAAVVALILVGGGGWTWLERQRRGRAEEVERHVGDSLGEATRLRGQAEAAGTEEALPLWREALAAAQRADMFTRSEDADDALRARAAVVTAGIAEGQHRAELAVSERRREEATVERLDEIRARVGETWNWKATEAAYAEAFRQHFGVDVEALPIDEAVRRLDTGRIRDRLAWALDDWRHARIQAGEGATALTNLLDKIDPDPWRAELRREPNGLPALRALAAKGDATQRSVLDLVRLADRFGASGDPERAAEVAHSAWRRAPGDFWACFSCAQWNRFTSPPRTREALRFYTAALAIRPRSAVVRNNVSLLLGAAGELDAAIRELREAIRIEPGFAPAHANLGDALREKGALDQAIEELREAIRLDATLVGPQWGLGLALRSRGRLQESLEAMRKVHELASQGKSLGMSAALVDKELAYAKRLVVAGERLPAFSRGETEPATAEDAVVLAQAAHHAASYAAATRAWARAFSMDPSLTSNLQGHHLHDAACAAALAGTGKGTDAGTLDDEGRARSRRQAIGWLRADVDRLRKITDLPQVWAEIKALRSAPDLRGLRDEAELSKVPPEDRDACRALWREVDELSGHLEPGK